MICTTRKSWSRTTSRCGSYRELGFPHFPFLVTRFPLFSWCFPLSPALLPLCPPCEGQSTVRESFPRRRSLSTASTGGPDLLRPPEPARLSLSRRCAWRSQCSQVPLSLNFFLLVAHSRARLNCLRRLSNR